MARLLPVLSRFDLDIEHMKTVVSRLTTYQPFRERLMTLEHVLSSSEVDKIVRALGNEMATHGLARTISLMREGPILRRQFAYLVAVLHRTAVMRANALRTPPPDLQSTLIRVLAFCEDGESLSFRLEPEVAEMAWPLLRIWGCLHPAPGMIWVPHRPDRSVELTAPDGTPLLVGGPDEEKRPLLSLRELVSSQMQNDMFVLGVLENPRAVSMPGVVELIASRSRSLRVLDKICRVRSLHTGLANRNVPAALLGNPASIPIQALRRFISVRFVSKVDLRRIARNPGGVRHEVMKEIAAYLDSIQEG
jgi:hypothetical protein